MHCKTNKHFILCVHVQAQRMPKIPHFQQKNNLKHFRDALKYIGQHFYQSLGLCSFEVCSRCIYMFGIYSVSNRSKVEILWRVVYHN